MDKIKAEVPVWGKPSYSQYQALCSLDTFLNAHNITQSKIWWFEARQGTSRKVFILGTVEAKGFLAESAYSVSRTKVKTPILINEGILI